MRGQFVTLAVVLATVFGVSSGFIPVGFPHFRHHFPEGGFFSHFVPPANIPHYIVRIFESNHFPFYQPGHYFGTKSYPINYLPPYLRRNKKLTFRTYTSYVDRVFGHQKEKH